MKPDTKHWQPGDVVSTASGIVGTVRRFGKVLKVEYGTPRRWDWPDHWLIGRGPREFDCLDCGQPYRTEATKRDFCPVCLRRFAADHAGHGTGIQKPRAYLHGASTNRAAVAEPNPEAVARQRAKDESESPF